MASAGARFHPAAGSFLAVWAATVSIPARAGVSRRFTHERVFGQGRKEATAPRMHWRCRSSVMRQF